MNLIKGKQLNNSTINQNNMFIESNTIISGTSITNKQYVYEVINEKYSFFSSYKIIDNDPRIPQGHSGIITVCSITMDSVLQKGGIPIKMAFGGTMGIENYKPTGFQDLIGYKGTTVDPLLLFINAGMTSIGSVIKTGKGTVLANVREVPETAENSINEILASMRRSGFIFPVIMGKGVLNVRPDPYRTSIVAYSGMNLIGYAIEKGMNLKTEIGAGIIPYSSFEF